MSWAQGDTYFQDRQEGFNAGVKSEQQLIVAFIAELRAKKLATNDPLSVVAPYEEALDDVLTAIQERR